MKNSEELPYIDKVGTLSAELRRLYVERLAGKTKLEHRHMATLTQEQRVDVLAKTEGRCHVCGVKLDVDDFEADHVCPHASGGESAVSNCLAACHHCNNYRWHYLPEELQWILKLGVWAKTQIEFETEIGTSMGNQFVKHERQRERRRKSPRVPYVLDQAMFPVRKNKFVE